MRTLFLMVFLGVTVFYQCHPATADGQNAGTQQVSCLEALMRQHALLDRLLLIYEELLQRAGSGKFPQKALKETTDIFSRYIQDYHERLEQKYLFPRFRDANKQVEMVETLHAQHRFGRILVTRISDLQARSPGSPLLAGLIRDLVRIYRVHKSWEDSVLFPEFSALLSRDEYLKMGEVFRTEGERLFGDDGFDMVLKKIEAIEKSLNMPDLKGLAPKS